MLLLVAACALVAAGCTVPGSSHLQGPPEGLPPSLDLVTADVLGYTLYDTDPSSKLWAGLGEETADEFLAALHAGINGGFDPDLDDISPWIGDAAGTALREFDLDGKTDTSTLYFADVRSRAKLETFLDDAGWSRAKDNNLSGPGEHAELWTHASGCSDTPNGTQGICAAPDHVAYEAAAVTDDAIVAARSTKALQALLKAADAYAVPDRKPMSDFTVEAAQKVPVAFVFRSDLVRTQVRRPFEDDPALLEFARWATDSNVLIALRDGWLGFAPALDADRRDEAVRLVGAAEWVPDLAPDITLGAAKPDLLAHLGPDVDVAVALDDPGQHVQELVRAITYGAGQYVTDGDVPDDGDRLELLPLLDRLDGNAAIGFGNGLLRVVLEDDQRLASDVVSALDHAGIAAISNVVGPDVTSVEVPVPVVTPKDARRSSNVELDMDGVRTTPGPTFRDFSGAGKPPRAPFAWIWTAGRGCIGDTAGWLTFDGTERMTLGMDVELHAGRTPDDAASLLGTCLTSIARTGGD